MKSTVTIFALLTLVICQGVSFAEEKKIEAVTGKDLDFVTVHGSVKKDGLLR